MVTLVEERSSFWRRLAVGLGIATMALWGREACAGSWVSCADGSSAVATTFLQPGRSLCFEWTATGAGTLIDVERCQFLTVGPLVPSTTDTATGATAYVYRCGVGTPGAAATAFGCIKMLVDFDGDGVLTGSDDVTLDGVTYGRQGQQYQDARLLYVDPQAVTTSKTARLPISCH